jgi:hypothetical protein
MTTPMRSAFSQTRLRSMLSTRSALIRFIENHDESRAAAPSGCASSRRHGRDVHAAGGRRASTTTASWRVVGRASRYSLSGGRTIRRTAISTRLLRAVVARDCRRAVAQRRLAPVRMRALVRRRRRTTTTTLTTISLLGAGPARTRAIWWRSTCRRPEPRAARACHGATLADEPGRQAERGLRRALRPRTGPRWLPRRPRSLGIAVPGARELSWSPSIVSDLPPQGQEKVPMHSLPAVLGSDSLRASFEGGAVCMGDESFGPISWVGSSNADRTVGRTRVSAAGGAPR